MAAMMVKEQVRRARYRGMRHPRVETDAHWTEAVALYRGCGFAANEATDEMVVLTMNLGHDTQH